MRAMQRTARISASYQPAMKKAAQALILITVAMTTTVVSGTRVADRALRTSNISAKTSVGPLAISGSNNNALFSVKDYGAKGDGSSDDTAAVQSAITDCSANCTVYFPV